VLSVAVWLMRPLSSMPSAANKPAFHRPLPGGPDGGWSVLSPDGALSSEVSRMVSGGWDRTVNVWDAGSGQQLLPLKGHLQGVRGVALSADGKRIVSGSADRMVKVWDAQTGPNLLTLKGHTNRVTSVAFRPDGQRIVSVSIDRTSRAWDAHSGQALLSFSRRFPRGATVPTRPGSGREPR
jgi:WD40 repeat protein